MANIRATAILSLKQSLPNLGVRASHIKVYSILNSLGPELEVKAYVLKKGSRLTVNSLSKTFYGPVYLRSI
jgi:hypothetical protein